MASLQKHGERFFCYFVYRGQRHRFALGNSSKAEADRVDDLLMRLCQGFVQVFVG